MQAKSTFQGSLGVSFHSTLGRHRRAVSSPALECASSHASTDTARGHGHAGISRSAVEANRIPVFVDDLTEGKYNVMFRSREAATMSTTAHLSAERRLEHPEAIGQDAPRTQEYRMRRHA
jgi:hypothetical protein